MKLDVSGNTINPTIGRVKRVELHPELANYFKLYSLQKKAERTRKYYTDGIGNQTRINYEQQFLCVECNTTMSEANKGYSFNCHSCWSKNK